MVRLRHAVRCLIIVAFAATTPGGLKNGLAPAFNGSTISLRFGPEAIPDGLSGAPRFGPEGIPDGYSGRLARVSESFRTIGACESRLVDSQ